MNKIFNLICISAINLYTIFIVHHLQVKYFVTNNRAFDLFKLQRMEETL